MSVNSLYRYPAVAGSHIKVQSCGLQSMSTTQINALTPTPGELVYNSTTDNLEYSDGTNWNQILSTAPGSTNYSVFRVNSNSPQVQTAGTGTVIMQNVTINNQNGLPGQYSISDNSYHCSLTGTYQFNFSTVYEGLTGTCDNVVFFIYKNGTDVLDSDQLPSSITSTDPAVFIHLSASDLCVAGDIINVVVQFTTSDGGQLQLQSGASYFSGCLVTYIPS